MFASLVVISMSVDRYGKKKILDSAPIQSLGVTNVRIELYKGIIATVKVHLKEN